MMFVDKILSLLIYPLGASILLAITALGFLYARRVRTGTVLATAALLWLTLWSLPPVADALVRSLEGQFADRPVEQLPKSDVILVFGGVIAPPVNGRAYANLGAAADRVWHAARLYHAGKAELIVLSAGRNDWQPEMPTQAATMAAFLRDLGVPESAIILEERSRNTYENAVYCAQVMRQRGANDALLVTSALHMPRAAALMERTGVTFTPAATDFEVGDGPRSALDWLPNAQALQGSTFALHEWIGIVVYRLRGWM